MLDHIGIHVSDYAAAARFYDAAFAALGGALVAGGLGLLIWDSLAGQPASDSGERTDPQARRTLRLAPRFSPGADAGAGLTFELGF